MTSLPSDLATLVPLLRSGDLPLATYLDALCNRIDEVNPSVLALLPERDRRSRLIEEGQALETRFPRPEGRPALFGVPVAVKDIIRADGFATRAGSALPSGLFEGTEASCVWRLREAGALVLGKTVSTEFAYFEPGATRNPRNLAHTPGGSSSGSAAAVAAGLAPLALGTQTVGSVIRPAAFCGIPGFKPSYGRVPTDGILPYSLSVDHVGFFTQDAAGLAQVAAVLLEGWRPEAHAMQVGHRPTVGVPDGAYLAQAEPAAREAFERQLDTLRRAGCTVRRVCALDDIEQIAKRHNELASAEFAEVHRRWFEEYGALYRPRTAALVRSGRAVTPREREAGASSRDELRARLQALMDEHGLDVWASPAATGPAPKGLASTGDPAMNLPWTHAGMPAVTLPAGLVDGGLPLGLQLSARFGEDEALLAWAAALETPLARASAEASS